MDGQWNKISDEAKQVIKLMLNKNYKTRLYAREILENPWFQNASKVNVDRELMVESLKNLKSFSATQKLQQATILMMVQNMISKQETARL